jgi:hypothetical protein
MVTRAHGPLMEDYKRAIRAAKWAGWKVVRVEVGNTAIALLADDTYLTKLAQGQPPAPDTAADEAERVRRSFDLKNW